MTQFIGVGVGPGDPELITVKAIRAIEQADVISYLVNPHGISQAKTIAEHALQNIPSHVSYLPIEVVMSNDRSTINAAYDTAAIAIEQAIQHQKTVVFLCEGYLLERLQTKVTCAVIPGISSVHAASACAQTPLAVLGETFAVINGRHSIEHMHATLLQYNSVVIMKAGKARARILQALQATNRSDDACYLSHIGRDNQQCITDVSQLDNTPGPYFSLFLVTKRHREHRVP